MWTLLAGRRALAAMAAVLALAACAGCGSGSSPAARIHGDVHAGYRGDPLSPPMRLTPADLTTRFASSLGGESTLATLQRRGILLLYFGYTHCPDICPTTMAALGSALHRLPADLARRVQVVFVTTDPGRDTPPVMRAWLANFDVGLPWRFVGLTSSSARIDAVAHTLHILIHPPVRHPNGTVTVQHSAETLAVVDGSARLLWDANTSASGYAGDLIRLAGSLRIS